MAESKYLKSPDGTLYVYTETLANLPGFVDASIEPAKESKPDPVAEAAAAAAAEAARAAVEAAEAEAAKKATEADNAKEPEAAA